MNISFSRVFLCLFLVMSLSSFVFSQEESLSPEEQIQKNTQTLLLKLREDIEKSDYNGVFSSLSQALSKDSFVVKTWFFYVMYAEAGKILGTLSTVINNIPTNGTFKVFSKFLSLWNTGDVLSSARLLSTIALKDPSLQYLTGKLYLSIGKLTQGAGYLYLGAQMKEAPYGLYYAGLSQNAVGNFGKAEKFLENAASMLLENEKDLSFQIRLQMSVAEFGDGDYKRAYEGILPLYNSDPVKVLKIMDPGMVLTAMKENTKARAFWSDALKKPLPSNIKQQIQKNLAYNKRLVDPEYPPVWDRH